MADRDEGAVEVEAEVIEEGRELTVSFVPASIEANFDALERHVDALLAPYEGATYDLASEGAVRDAKRDRAYLNGVAKDIDEHRKAVKREYMRPYDAFDSRATAIVAKVRAASSSIKAQLDEAEGGAGRAGSPSSGSTTRASPGSSRPWSPTSVSTRTGGSTRP